MKNFKLNSSYRINNLQNVEVNTLVMSISKKVPLIRCLRNAYERLNLYGKIIGADADPNCIGRFFVDSFWCSPLVSELTIKELIKYCKDNNIRCIIPTRDGELQFFSEAKSLFNDSGIRTIISKPEAVSLCLDKLKFYKELNQNGFPVIETVVDIAELICKRFVAKERYGAGAQNIGLDLSRDEAVKHATMLDNPVFQPFIDGTEVSVDLYISEQGQAKGVVARTRDLVVAGESQITTTIQNKEIEMLCSKLGERLGLYGHVVFQVIIDRNSKPHIIECNSRFGGASTLSLEVGLDSFYWFLLESIGEDISDLPFERSLVEKRQVRFAEDLIL